MLCNVDIANPSPKSACPRQILIYVYNELAKPSLNTTQLVLNIQHIFKCNKVKTG